MTRILTLLAVNGLAGCAGPGHVGAPPNGRFEAAVAACTETIVPATMANLRDCLDMHGLSGRDMRYPDSGARRRRRRRLERFRVTRVQSRWPAAEERPQRRVCGGRAADSGST
jgi:hypothetical protein